MVCVCYCKIRLVEKNFFGPVYFPDALVHITVVLPKQAQYKNIYMLASLSCMCAGCVYSSSNGKYTIQYVGMHICSGQF